MVSGKVLLIISCIDVKLYILTRCKKKCNLIHTNCKRGILPDNIMHCQQADELLKDTSLTYIIFELHEVETFGKGKPFSRMEKVELQVSYDTFVSKFRFETGLVS